MEKIITAAIFVAAGTLLGLYQSFKLKRREEFLTEIIRMLAEMTAQIRYRMPPVERLIEELSECQFLNSVRLELKNESNKNWKTAWEKAAHTESGLDEKDRSLLLLLGKQLGESDLEGQMATLELNKSMFAARLAEAAEETAKKSKMYRSVGTLAGLGLGIVIM